MQLHCCPAKHSAPRCCSPRPLASLQPVPSCTVSRCEPHHQRLIRQLGSRLVATAAGSGDDSSSSSSSSGTASEADADDTIRRLHRLNSIQKGYLEQPDKGSICCWDQEQHDSLPKHHTSRRGVSNQVQLSTYPDSIGGDLAHLQTFLQQHVGHGAIGSVHLLPLYPSTGDRGFAPITYQEVDHSFGSWNNVRELGMDYQLCLEYMVNHISPASPQFQGYLQEGAASRFSDMFVKWRDIWPAGKPTAEQLARIRTRKPAPPVIEVTMADGSKVPLWNTFTDQQIDINPFSAEGWKFTEASLVSLCVNGGAKLIRLDAFGYVTKKAGTNCFMEEPEVWDLLERIRKVVKPYGVQLLCEVHEDFKLNIELARHGFWVYDFALPMLLLHALKFQTAESLKHWLSICPRRQITTLDTHDGMGVDDVAGLAPLVDVREVEQAILDLGGTVNYKHFYEPEPYDECSTDSDGDCLQCRVSSQKSLEAVKNYLQPDCLQGCYTSVQHQYNATYFSATKDNPQYYLMARAVQFFTPGVPMVYYVGLLAGKNDYELLEKGGIRDINRHSYSLEEAARAVQRPVVQALLKLCRFRNLHPAFKGRVFIDDNTPPHLLRVCWYKGTRHLAVLRADFKARQFSISHTPYKTPNLADASADESELHSDYSLDLAQVFSVDAMDLADRAQSRLHMASCASDMGIADPEELLTRDSGDQAASAASSDNGNGSQQSTDTGVQQQHVALPIWLAGAAAAADSSSSGNGNGQAGGSGGADSDGSSSSSEASPCRQQGEAQERLAVGESDSGGGNITQKGAEVGLLQLDLSFAWRLQDEPVEDVEQLLVGEGAVQRR